MYGFTVKLLISEPIWSFLFLLENDLVSPLDFKLRCRFGVDGFVDLGAMIDVLKTLSFGLLKIIPPTVSLFLSDFFI